MQAMGCAVKLHPAQTSVCTVNSTTQSVLCFYILEEFKGMH